MIGVKGTYVKLSDVDLLVNPAGQITPRSMIRNVQHLRVEARVRADITIAGGAASGTLRNRGLASSFIRRVNISENGDKPTQVDTRALKVFAQAMAPKEQEQVVALVNGDPQVNTILEDYIPLHFALPLLASPHETNYLERNPDQPLEIEFETVPAFREALLDGSDRTFTVNSLTVEIGQKVDRVTTQFPFFIPAYRQIANQVITGAVTDFEIELNPKGYLAMLLVQQDVGTGPGWEVDDIIDTLELKGTSVRHFEGRFTDDWYRQHHEGEFGGVIPAGYTVFPFIENGRLSGIHNPVSDPDLKLVVDGSPSAVAGTSVIKVWALELNQDPQLTAQLPAGLIS